MNIIEVVNQWRTDNTNGLKNKSPLLDSLLDAYIYIYIYMEIYKPDKKNICQNSEKGILNVIVKGQNQCNW